MSWVNQLNTAECILRMDMKNPVFIICNLLKSSKTSATFAVPGPEAITSIHLLHQHYRLLSPSASTWSHLGCLPGMVNQKFILEG